MLSEEDWKKSRRKSPCPNCSSTDWKMSKDKERYRCVECDLVQTKEEAKRVREARRKIDFEAMKAEENRTPQNEGGLLWTSKLLEKIEKLAKKGATPSQIAQFFNLHPKSFDRHLKSNSLVQNAFNRGLARGTEAVLDKAYEMAISGDKSLITLWLKCKLQWKEVSQFEHVGSDGGPVQYSTKVDYSKYSPEELDQLDSLMRKGLIQVKTDPDEDGEEGVPQSNVVNLPPKT